MSSCMYQQHQRKLAASSKTLYHELKAREYGSRRHDRDGGVQRLYEFVTPNKTYYDVAIDSVCYHIRRFTDDGKYLVCFPETLDGIAVYWFNLIPSSIPATSDVGNSFDHYFTLKYHRTYQMEYDHYLCDDFLLIINQNKHLVVVSTSLTTITNGTSQFHEARYMQKLLSVFDYTFYIADLETGEMISSYSFPQECIPLGDQNGVSLHDDLLAVILVLSQDICILRVCPQGTLTLIQRISQQLEPPMDDAITTSMRYHSTLYDSWMTASEVETMQHSDIQQGASYGDYSEQHHGLPYTGFMNALLRWLFIQAKEGGSLALAYFYNRFQWYESLQLWRMQFLDNTTLLIKLVSHKSLTLLYEQETTWKDTYTLFVIFDWNESRIVDAFDNSSTKVARTIFSRESRMECVARMSDIFSSTIMMDESTAYERLKRAISSWQNKDDTGVAMMKLSLLLPTPPMSQPECPYFDRGVFSYSSGASGHGWWEPQVRKIRFYSRRSGKLAFEIGAKKYREEEDDIIEGEEDESTMMLAIPHPQLPFMITRHKTLSLLDLVTNFHVYNPA